MTEEKSKAIAAWSSGRTRLTLVSEALQTGESEPSIVSGLNHKLDFLLLRFSIELVMGTLTLWGDGSHSGM